MKNIIKKISQVILAAFVVAVVGMGAVKVSASETSIEANYLLNLNQDVTVYEQPDQNSTVLGSLTQGTPVISLENSENGWVKIKYQSIEGYINTYEASVAENTGVANEFEEQANENKLVFEELQYNQTQSSHKSIFIIAVVVIVVVMVVSAIVMYTLSKKTGNLKKR